MQIISRLAGAPEREREERERKKGGKERQGAGEGGKEGREGCKMFAISRDSGHPFVWGMFTEGLLLGGPTENIYTHMYIQYTAWSSY